MRPLLLVQDLSLDFSIHEIKAASLSLKFGKAPGLDSIHNEFLSHLGLILLKGVTCFFFLICASTLTTFLNCGAMSQLLQSLSRKKCELSYQLPTHLSSLLPVLEQVIFVRITPIIESILPLEQTCLRQRRSTLDQVARITDDVEESFDMGQVTGAVFLDLTAAYDTAWRKVYIQRLSPRGRPWPRGHILKSLALALTSKVKSLASRPQVLENWPVLGSRTAVFFLNC